jgi:glycosyltransferase involved in cell wall biosynthesis
MHFAGISRYTARLALALGARIPVRFFHEDRELLPRKLDWSQDQDLEEWGRRIWNSGRRPLGTPPEDSIGLYCAIRPGRRNFPYEVSILHDFCPVVVPWAFPDGARDEYVQFLTEDIAASDVVLADSRSTKADAAWFSPLDAGRIVVAYPGPSLCVDSHRHHRRVERSDRIGLVVSTIEPRKNAAFLFDWFHETALLPRDMELWWVGKLGWMTAADELERLANRPGGRRIRLLGNVSDARLCELYQQAVWSIYPSRYEGFGFPILDALRHGTPVLASNTSSMAEFDHPGVFFFDPQDPATVDSAWRRLEAARPVTIPRAGLDALYNWDLVAGAILDAYERDRAGGPAGRPRSRRPEPGVDGAAAGDPVSPAHPMPAAPRVRMRIGIEVFGTRTLGTLRGIGRYIRELVTAMLIGRAHL